MSLDERKFDLVADRWLNRIESSLGELDPDDCDVTLSQGVLTLEFADGAKFVINSHRAARQIWMAANVRAWHFSYDMEGDRWYDERSGLELIQVIEEQVSARLECAVKI